jgi:2-keto-4-pentenoate hydratase
VTTKQTIDQQTSNARNDRIERAAHELAARYRQGSKGGSLAADSSPADVSEALAIQQAVQTLLNAQTGGWKCSLPNAGQPVLAPIYRDRIVHAAQTTICRAPASQGEAEIEPEIAYVIGSDLPPRATPYSTQEVLQAVASTHLAFELIGSRYLDRKQESFIGKLADRLANDGLFVGPAIDGALNQGDTLAAFALSLRDANGELGNWSGKHPDGHPLTTLHWLVNYLAANGNGLQRGMVVTTGSYQGVIKVPANTAVHMQYGSLGQLDVTVQAA